MDSQRWLDRVRERLAKRVLPPSYVQRFIEELTDHLEDLKEEKMEGDASSRLGEPDQVVDNAIAEYQQRSFHISLLKGTIMKARLGATRTFVLALLLAGLFVLSAYRMVWYKPSPIMNPLVAGQHEHVR